MKTAMMVTTALMSVLMVNTASANESRGFYLGGAIGTSGIDDGGLVEKSLVPIEVKAEDSTYKIIAGYQFNNIAAIEAQYTNYGDINFSSPSPLYPSGKYSWTPTILSLSANLGYTFANGIRPFGIMGVTSIDLNESTQNISGSNNGGGVRYGFGIEYTPYNTYETYADVSIRLGYEADTFTIESGDPVVGDKDIILDSYYVAVNFRF